MCNLTVLFSLFDDVHFIIELLALHASCCIMYHLFSVIMSYYMTNLNK